MDIIAILTPVLIMAVLGAVLGLILAVASKKFHVEVDPRVDEVLDALPGANCGACGFAGCAAYAEAIVEKGADITLCAPGSAAVAENVAGIMGMTANVAEPNFAVVQCDGDGVRHRFNYAGVTTCKAASVMGLAGSFQECPYGCLGLGSCIEVCPFGAMKLNKNNVVEIDETVCAGCGKCVEVCPRNLIRLDPESRVIVVRCQNHDKGAKANKACNHACIACQKCVKECPFDAIHIENNLAVIDYDKCKLCGKCVAVCPKNLIANVRNERKRRRVERVEAETV